MRKPILTIFYQFNPWQSSIGGIQTVIVSFIKHAPADFTIRLVGTGCDPKMPVRQWYERELEGRELLFMPLFRLENDDIRHTIPTSVKYTAALLGRDLSSDFMHFYRLEPSLAALPWKGEKTFFIQNDIRTRLFSKDAEKSILWRKFPAAYFALERLLVGQFDQILSCNSNSVDFYQERYPDIANRVKLFRNTVDSELFYPDQPVEREAKRVALAQKLGLSSETRFILFAGRLHPQKDPLLLIRSIDALNDPQAHLLIAGDGELSDLVKAEIARLNLSQRVTMLGPVSQKELADLHRLSSVLILTSVYEGLPFVVLEALACGTPIVTTVAGETPSLLSSNNGIVCLERTQTAIAAALQQVLNHPERYPVEACVRATKPYQAQTVIGEVYNGMLERWDQMNHQQRIAINAG